MAQLDDLQTYTNAEMPRRSAFLTTTIAGYDGDPNDGGASDILKNSPVGTWYLQDTGLAQWRKLSAGAATWVASGGGGGVEVYTTEVALLADTPDDGSMGYATDTDRFWFRATGAWLQRGQQVSTDLVTSPGTGTGSERYGNGATSAGDNNVVLGASAAATGGDSVCIGQAAVAVRRSVVIGKSAHTSTEDDSVAVGYYAKIDGSDGVAVGFGAETRGNWGVSVGYGAIAAGTSTAIGKSSYANANNSTCIGYAAATSVSGQSATCVGSQAVTTKQLTVCIGAACRTNAELTVGVGGNVRINDPAVGDNIGSIAIGYAATIGDALTAVDAGIAIGYQATVKASALNGVALGASAVCDAVETVAIGHAANATGNYATSIGSAAVSAAASVTVGWHAISQANSVVIGYNTSELGSGGNVLIGHSASITGGVSNKNVVIGPSATTSEEDTVTIGYNSETVVVGAVALGYSALVSAGATHSIAVGYGSRTAAAFAVSVGRNATIHAPATGANVGAIALGSSAVIGDTLNGTDASVALGHTAKVDGLALNGVAIGFAAQCSHSTSVALGRSAITTAANRVTFGTIGGSYDVEGQFGKGIILGGNTSAMAGAVEWDGSNFVGHNGVGWVELDASAAGDVAGPGSATDEAIALFSGTTGKIIENSGFTIVGGTSFRSPATGQLIPPTGGFTGSAAVGGATINNTSCLAIGDQSVVGHLTVGGQSVALGHNAKALASFSVSIGSGAQITGTSGGVAVGQSAQAWGSGTAIGRISSVTGTGGVAIGYATTSTGSSVAIGQATVATGSNAVAIGKLSNVSVTNSIAIGYGTTITHAASMAIGRSAVSTAVNRATFGTIGGSYDVALQAGLGIGLWQKAPPVSQPIKIADPTSGSTVDTEARIAINALIDALEAHGITASI